MLRKHESLQGDTGAPLPGDAHEPLREIQGSETPAVEALRESLSTGAIANARQLHEVLRSGSAEERSALRKAMAEPGAVARNQDFNLHRIPGVISHDPKAVVSYRQERIILAETLPQWAAEQWQSEAKAAWRSLDLHGKEMRRFCAQLRHGGVEENFRKILIPPLALHSDSERSNFKYKISGALGPGKFQMVGSVVYQTIGRRASFITHHLGIAELDSAQQQSSQVGTSRDQLTIIADTEIRHGLRSLTSPTPIGKHCRKVARIELNQLSAFFLVEDIAVALQLPLDRQVKLALWGLLKEDPWGKLQEKDMQLFFSHLRSLPREGAEEADLGKTLLPALKSPASLICFAAALRAESRKVELRHVAPESLPAIPAAPDQSSDGDIKPDAEGQQYSSSKRLALQAALENTLEDSSEAPRQARLMSKLIGSDSGLFEKVMEAIAQGADVETLLQDLRAKRPLSVLHPEPRTGPEVPAPRRPVTSQFDFDYEPDQVTFIFTSEAKRALTDGALRTHVDQELEKLAEYPEISDIHKIRETTDVWELRLMRESKRIYYFHAGGNRTVILLIGDKTDQKFDIRKLQGLRDREKARLKLEDAENS